MNGNKRCPCNFWKEHYFFLKLTKCIALVYLGCVFKHRGVCFCVSGCVWCFIQLCCGKDFHTSSSSNWTIPNTTYIDVKYFLLFQYYYKLTVHCFIALRPLALRHFQHCFVCLGTKTSSSSAMLWGRIACLIWEYFGNWKLVWEIVIYFRARIDMLHLSV